MLMLPMAVANVLPGGLTVFENSHACPAQCEGGPGPRDPNP